MTRFFINLFGFFRKHQLSLFSLMTLSFVVFVYFGTKLVYEENIAKLLPSTDNTKAEGLVFTELKVRDKVVIQLRSKNGETDVNALMEASDRLVDSLMRYDAMKSDVGDVLYMIDEAVKQQALRYALENIPALLDPACYEAVDSLTAREQVFRQMEANYEKIISPEGIVFRRFMQYDPINLRSVVLSGNDADFAQILGGSYTIFGNHLFSTDTTVAFVFVSPNFVSFDAAAGTRLVKKIQRAAKKVENDFPDIEVMLHGPPVQSMFNSRQIRQDLMLTIGISLLFSCLLIMVCFRNKTTLPMLLLPVVFGAFFALAGMFLLQGMMSLMALGIGAIVLGVALSYCLHVITHFKYLTDPVRVLRDQAKPVILGSLTTIGAFMGLMFTESPLLRDFGLFASLSMVGTTIACLIFLPHVFPYVRNRRSARVFRVLEKINSYHLDRQYWLLVLIVGVFILGLFFQSRVKFDTNLRNIGYFDPEVTRSMDLFAEKTSKGYAISYYAATSENLDDAFTVNMRVSDVCDSLLAAGTIADFTRSSALLLPKAEQEKRITAWKDYWSAGRMDELKRNVTDAGAAYRFRPAMFATFFELIAKDYEPASLYESGVLPEGIMSNLVEHSQGLYIVYTAVHLSVENQKQVHDILAAQPNVIVIDPYYYTTNMVELMHNDFLTILGISSLLVLLVLFASFRNIWLTLIAFLPMGMSWYTVLGMMAILGLQFNLINIVISSFIFGIGVDYSIFVMEGLLSDVRGYDPKLLMYHKTAIFLSAVVLIVSISSLMFATHPALSSIGMATLIGMTSTILASYSLQPFLFKMLMKSRFGKGISKKYEKNLHGKV